MGESAAELSGKFPGSTLGSALAAPVLLPDGAKDLYIQQDKFSKQFAEDVSPALARLMAVSQRPITEGALGEASPAAAWKNVPSWFIYGDRDKNIPAAAQAFMAERAKSMKTVVVKGASHVVMISRPKLVTRLIAEAADAVSTAQPEAARRSCPGACVPMKVSLPPRRVWLEWLKNVASAAIVTVAVGAGAVIAASESQQPTAGSDRPLD